MRKEFAEYQREHNIAQSKSPQDSSKPIATSTVSKTKKHSEPTMQEGAPGSVVEDTDIPFHALKLQRPPSMSPPPPPSNTSPFEIENKNISGQIMGPATKESAPTSTSSVSTGSKTTAVTDPDRLESLI